MKKISLSILLSIAFSLFFIFSCNKNHYAISSNTIDTSNTHYTDLSKKFILQLMEKKDVQDIIEALKNADKDLLAKELNNDNQKKAFWVNIYNGFIQVQLMEDIHSYDDRNAFFKAKKINIAGELLSFDNIEHGIIRRSKIKLSLGLLSKWNVSDFEKQFRTDKTDPRVHFVLNCGAKSCPAVAAYEASRLDEQMNASTLLHLKNTSSYDAKNNSVKVTSLFSWFRGDFGNSAGIRDFLKYYKVIPNNVDHTLLEFQSYDWTVLLNNYIDI